MDGPEVVLSVERAACALLLGDSTKALALLRLDGSEHNIGPDEGVKSYVLVSNPC
jgi:hypothetical protein